MYSLPADLPQGPGGVTLCAMSQNPYESPSAKSSQDHGNFAPWIQRACWVGWIAGTVLIAMSWFNLVSPIVGWSGFGVAAVASLASSMLPRWLRRQEIAVAQLTTRMLEVKNDEYAAALEYFRQGGLIHYDGATLALKDENQIAFAMYASCPVEQLDESRALQDAQSAQSVFEFLQGMSPDFAKLAAGRTLRVSIMKPGDSFAEVCRVVDHRIEWSDA